MGKIITLVFGLAILAVIVYTIYKVVPRVWKAWFDRSARKHELNKKRIAYERSHDLLTLLLTDPKVASLVLAGLQKHADELQIEKLSEEELASLSEEYDQKRYNKL